MNFEKATEKYGRLEDKQYIAFMDLELTCWEDVRWSKDQEIIEIGILVTDVTNLEEVTRFECFVKPSINTEITDYCTNLTGITFNDIKDAPNLNDALLSFYSQNRMIFSPSDHNFIWATWGRDSVWLHTELKKNFSDGIFATNFDSRYINVKTVEGNRGGLKAALKRHGIEQEKPAHRALADAISTWKLGKKLKVSPLDCQVTNAKTYKQQITHKQNQSANTLSKRTGISQENCLKILKYVEFDYTKALNIIKLAK